MILEVPFKKQFMGTVAVTFPRHRFLVLTDTVSWNPSVVLSTDRSGPIVSTNAVQGVWNLVFVNSIVDNPGGPREYGIAVQTPGAERAAGHPAGNNVVTLGYRFDLSDAIGAPHSMFVNSRAGFAAPGDYGAIVAADADLTNLGRTIAHETGHYLGFADRSVPAGMLRGRPKSKYLSHYPWDWISDPTHRNVMDYNVDASGPLNSEFDFDLIQTMVAHGLL